MALRLIPWKTYATTSGGGNDWFAPPEGKLYKIDQGSLPAGFPSWGANEKLIGAWWSPSEGLSLSAAMGMLTGIEINREGDLAFSFYLKGGAALGRFGFTIYLLVNG